MCACKIPGRNSPFGREASEWPLNCYMEMSHDKPANDKYMYLSLQGSQRQASTIGYFNSTFNADPIGFV